ncbi:MAG: glycoside hydrolase family 127 protein [Patescibacteria group bacterium]|nr:glycoside hydrolase family 127 protein [Patescibacteria group bacterium]
MFKNKKKTTIFFAVLFLIVFLSILAWFPAVKYYKNFLETKAIKKDVCRSFPAYIELSPVADYIIPQKKFQPWKPLDNIYSLKEQYAFCLLFQSGGDKANLTVISSGNSDNEQFFKEYEILSTVNKIFKEGNSSSTKALKYAVTLKKLLPPQKLRNVDEKEMYNFLMTKPSPTEDDFRYISALRNDDKEKCQEIGDMYISIACQAYFIKNKNQFCDKIYNEIKKEACD